MYNAVVLFRVDDVEGLETLRWEDQQRIRKYVEGGAQTNSTSPAVMEYGVEVSQTSRAACRSCNQKIMKGEVGFCMLQFTYNIKMILSFDNGSVGATFI